MQTVRFQDQPDRKYLIERYLSSSFWTIDSISDEAFPLYDQALTHSSYANEQLDKGLSCKDYERLEFLGDRILNCAVADFLYRTYPRWHEGDLTGKIKVTKNENLACVVKAKNLGLEPPLLKLSKHHPLKDSILADVFEALFGAIYLDPDQGLKKIHKLVEGSLSDDILAFDPTEDHISRLNEYVQQLFSQCDGRQPTKDEFDYVPISDRVDHQNCHTFIYEVRLQGSTLGKGTGSNSKEAKQSAAKEALRTLGQDV